MERDASTDDSQVKAEKVDMVRSYMEKALGRSSWGEKLCRFCLVIEHAKRFLRGKGHFLVPVMHEAVGITPHAPSSVWTQRD